MHVLVSGIPLLLLAAAANAILFDLVPTNQLSGGVVYEVRATVTLKSPEQNVDEGTRVRYAGDLAVYPVGKNTYQACFLNLSMVRYKPSTRTACPGCSLETLIIAPPERSSPSLTIVKDADQSQVRPPVLETLIIAPPERRYPSPTAVNDADQSQVRPPVLETLIIAPPERSSPPLTAVKDADQSQVRPPVLETLIIAPPERRYPPPTAVNDADQSQVRPPVLETLIIAPPERSSPPLTAVKDADQSQVRPPVLETLIIAPPERRYPSPTAANDADQSQVRPPVLETVIIAPPERSSPPLTAVKHADQSQVRPPVLETLIIAPPERRYPSLTAVNDADQSQVRPPVLETLIIAPPERRYPPLTVINDADRSQLLGYPVKFVLQSGKLVEYEISLGAPAWINSVYKTVLTLLQNQVEAPRESPAVSSYYEDGVSGYCRVTYEVHSLTNLHTEDRAYNVTKTKRMDDCLQRQHVGSTSNTRGHSADRTKHLANNLLPLPLDNTFENQPFTRRPEDLNKVNSEATAHEVSYYSVNDSLVESALFDSLTVLPLTTGTGPALVRAQLQLKLASHAAPPMGTAQFDRQRRTSLKLDLSEVVAYLNVSAYSDLVVEPEVFTQLLDEVAEELATLEFNVAKKSPVIMLKLARIISLLNIEQLKQAMPSSLLKKTTDLEPKEQLLRALYIELLGNARSKSAAQMAIHLMNEHILSRQEAARLFRELSAFFMTYIDEDTREMLQDMCRSTDGLVDTRLRAATCSVLAEMAIKLCPPGHISR